MNKRGDKVISVYWFVMLFLVAAALSYMAYVFYGSPYDVRQIEANLLADSIADCVASGGMIEQGVLSLNDANFMNECKLNFNVEDAYGWNNDQYYVELTIKDFDMLNVINSVVVGDTRWKDSCSFKLNKNPYCEKRSFYAVDGNGGDFVIEVFTSVRKTEKNE